MAVIAPKGVYPPNWKEISDQVKADNDYKCENCKHTRDPIIGRSIGTHHLDRDKSNSERWNLACLCNGCHLVVEQLDIEVLLLIYQSPGIFGDNWPWLAPHIPGIIEALKKRQTSPQATVFNLENGLT